MNTITDVQAKIGPYLKIVDGLSYRERLLMLVTILAALAGIWQVILMEPLGRRADAGRVELNAVEARTAQANKSLEEQILQLAGSGGEDRARIAMLRQRIDEINATLENYASELIDPAEMARVLEQVLRYQSGLTLVRIRNTAPQALSENADSNVARLFRHGLEIEVEGSFADCVDYLTEIEALPWRLYWQVLDLEVLEYPRNRIRLEVSTLSVDEEWIGA